MSISSRHARPRARDLGIPFEGRSGPFNAITDVTGVAVGTTTLVSGHGKLEVGRGPVRTGVTAILPRKDAPADPVFAGWFPLNGNGEMTGTAWIDESGFLEGPILLTNTHSVGVVRDAVVAWQIARGSMFQDFCYPVVGETYDGWLNDTNGFHVKAEHAFAALDGAVSGPVPEGNVGGGTGMVSFGFKAGTGTASRVTESGYTVGVLVQANFGRRPQLTIAGVPVGHAIPVAEVAGPERKVPGEQGSILVIVATDAPLLPHQLARVARRGPLGLARTGGCAGNGSGDLMLAFSTANAGAARLRSEVTKIEMLANVATNEIFDGTIQATEEAIVNALVAAETMDGVDGRVVHALPHARLREVLLDYNRSR